MNAATLLEQTITIARAAGDVVLSFYAAPPRVEIKADGSPVTEADRQAEALITRELARIAPGIPVVGEEAIGTGRPASIGNRFWLVDPLDGTKEFIDRRDQFTVNIALIENGRPVLGVIVAPALGATYAGAEGLGATVQDASGRRSIACRLPPRAGLTVVSSRSHGDPEALTALLCGRRVAGTTTLGSSLKFCLVAAGAADLYPRLGRTMEWDTAAGDAILRAAGGSVRSLDGTDIAYGKAAFANPPFLAAGLPL